ncbi:hypothetical protein K435DRAFT_493896 [Dendrothele bispora CBS 962.96]|uniref:Uncharacterized protein n=1 Tax=Dendrothele bispora (strain CBS 962.96) TaxID=1314807 RepID=A0A4S8MBS4_DENBC|nr:hypothetical protein K435DRAFT_493896 [Dendrothele bispora CBS 962.96]
MTCIFDDYQEIRRGDMCIVQRVGLVRHESAHKKFWKSLGISLGQKTSSRNATIENVISKIEVVQLPAMGGKRFTAITYEGIGAYQQWKEDMQNYSSIKRHRMAIICLH